MSKNNGFSFGIGNHSNISANEIINTKIDNNIKENENIDVIPYAEEGANDTDCSFVVVKQSRTSKKAETKVSTSIALTPNASDILSMVYKHDSTMKSNTTINKVLEICYDADTKTFKQDIPAKEVEQNINHSIQISKKHKDALTKEAKKRNMTVGEYLSELIIKTIKFD